MTVSSGAVAMTLPMMSAYAASKASISKFHEGLITELEGTGVFSLAVHPGTVSTELGDPTDAINPVALEHPALKQFLAYFMSPDLRRQSVELPADFMVALAADERCKALQGMHVNATEELEPVLEEAEKEGRGRIGSDRLYLVTVPPL